VCAAEDDFDLAWRVADFGDEGLDSLADFVLLAGDLLGAGHDAFAFAQCDDDGNAFFAGDGSADDRADLVFVFVVDGAAFVLADELDHDLFDGLSTDATHDFEVDDFLAASSGNDAGRSIESHVEFGCFLGIEMFTQTVGDRLFDVEKDGFFFDGFIACDGVDGAEEFLVHGGPFQ